MKISTLPAMRPIRDCKSWVRRKILTRVLFKPAVVMVNRLLPLIVVPFRLKIRSVAGYGRTLVPTPFIILILIMFQWRRELLFKILTMIFLGMIRPLWFLKPRGPIVPFIVVRLLLFGPRLNWGNIRLRGESPGRGHGVFQRLTVPRLVPFSIIFQTG